MSAGPMASPVFVSAPPAAGGGGSPSAEVIVPNEAAASALAGLIDGQQVFIKSHRSWWRFNANSPAPVVAHVVLASASPGASPRLLRTAYAAPEWRESITDVYIDPANSTGIANDENQAIFNAPQIGNARQPLLTWQELFRRWGHRNVINTGDLVNLTFQVHVLSSEPPGTLTQDPTDIDFVAFVDTFPRILGEANTVLLAGVLDAVGGFTAQNPAVPAPGGTPCSIKVGAQVWAAFLGKRIRFTATGAVATILKDLGAGSARISQPQVTNEPFFFTFPTNTNPANGAAFVVEDLATVNLGSHWWLGFMGSNFFFQGQVNVADLQFPQTNTEAWSPGVEDGQRLVVYQCVSDQTLGLDPPVIYNGCTCRANLGAQEYSSKGAFWGGAVFASGARIGVSLSGTSYESTDTGQLDFFAYVQGTQVTARGTCQVGAFSVWDAIVVGTINPGGHGFCVGGAAEIRGNGQVSQEGSQGVIFGSGSAGRGMRVASGSTFDYESAPNITGAGGDFQLADDTSAIPLYDTPSYVYARVTDGQVVGNATDVGLQAATSGNLVIAANTIALVAGKTYRLRAELRGDTTTLGETLDFAWVDAGTNAELIANTGRGQISNVATNAAESYGVAEIIYKPAANQTVKLRCINAVIGGNTTLRQITGRVEAESLFEFPIACTWANVALSVAAGGFGGSAHNPRQDAHINQAAAT